MTGERSEPWTHGKVLRRYVGTGVLVSNWPDIPCAFELVQLSRGSIVAQCQFSELVPGFPESTFALRGTTHAGVRIETEPGLLTHQSHSLGGEGGQTVTWRLILTRRLPR